MADFSTNVGSSGGAAPQPLQPVQDKSSLLAINAISDIGGKLLSVGAAAIQKNQAQEEQAALNTLVGGFAQKQLNIASAVETGELSSQEGRMRMRANYTEAISNNPGLVDVLAKTQKEIVTTAGLGSVVVEGTEQEQMQRELTKTAVNAGWVKANASPEEAAAGVAAYGAFKKHQDDINGLQNQLSYDTAQINNSRAKIGLQTDKIQQVTAGYSQQTARIGLEEKVQQQRSQMAVGGMADAYYWKLNSELEDIKQRKAANQLTEQEAVQLADQAYSTVQQAINMTGRSAGSDYVSNVTAPMKGLYENSKQFLTGEIDEKVLNTKLAVTLGQSKLNIAGDPDTAKVLALTQLLGPAAISLQGEITGTVAKILGKNADPRPEIKPHDVLPDTPEQKRDNKTYLSTIKANLAGLNAVEPAKQAATVDEINTNITNILKSIDIHSVSVSNPAEYNDVTDFLASPEYGRFTTKGGGFYEAAAANANTILQSQYVDKVSPLIQQQYQQALIPQRSSNVYQAATGPVDDTGVTSAVSATAAVKPFFSGGGVVFRADPSASTSVKNKVNELNKTVAPIVNKLIRMDAHLNGDTNYKSSYDRNFQTIFGFDQKDLTPKASDTNAE
jgi:hypothetical protein